MTPQTNGATMNDRQAEGYYDGAKQAWREPTVDELASGPVRDAVEAVLRATRESHTNATLWVTGVEGTPLPTEPGTLIDLGDRFDTHPYATVRDIASRIAADAATDTEGTA